MPILLGDDMRPLQPMQDFLVWRLLGNGVALSTLTWEAYGRALWDFSCFLHANDLTWNSPFTAPGKGPVSRYRDWSLHELRLSARTVNSRLRLVTEFYEWAQRRQLIDVLPFGYLELRARPIDHLLMHVDRGQRTNQRPDVEVVEWVAPPEFLTSTQLDAVRALPVSTSWRLLVDLMARVGLRSVEARTFPLSRVFNPASRAGCEPGQMIRVRLDPREMQTKFSKPRDVDVPYSLMQDLYAYTLYERNRLAKPGSPCKPLILTVGGRPFSKDAIVGVFQRISRQAGFRTTALMLRHSYAIHTLSRLRANPQYHGEPLLYVRDRLGHADVQTTTVYLRQIEQLAGATALAIEDEFNALFASRAT